MKKRITAAALAVLLVGLGVLAWRHWQLNRNLNVQPLRIMVDGTRYCVCGSLESRPDASPDGKIRVVIDRLDWPDEDGEANFGTAGMPYWRIGEEIVVEASQYYVFRES